jgi:2-dehydro-3-deoxy-L-rhamnonate dehydrogenase (NAD+)
VTVDDDGAGTVLVVGAASGIGAAAAEHLAARGWRVVGADRDEDGLATVGEVGVVPVAMDVTDEDTVRDGVAEATAAVGALDAVVNCVGTTGGGWRPFAEVTVDHLDELYRVNLRGAFLVTAAVLPAMRARGYGRLLHVASIAAKEGVPGMAGYCATKAGLVGLVRSVAREIATEGVTVNALAPALVHTPLTEAMPEEQYAYLRDLAPMRRAGTVEECAAMIAWIVSPACSFTTGATFDLSGGRADY